MAFLPANLINEGLEGSANRRCPDMSTLREFFGRFKYTSFEVALRDFGELNMEQEKLHVGVLGVGVIGGAHVEAFEELGHVVICHDKKLDSSLDDLLCCDGIFIWRPQLDQAEVRHLNS